MIGFQLTDGTRLFEFLDGVRSNNGLPMLLLIALIAFMCCLLTRLTWKVWRAAMEAKDQQIARLTQERDRYQSVIFERLLGSDDLVIFTQRGWPEDEGGGGSPSQGKFH